MRRGCLPATEGVSKTQALPGLAKQVGRLMLSATTKGRRASRPNQCRMDVWVKAAAKGREWAKLVERVRRGVGRLCRSVSARPRRGDMREV
jgi:hypothetical protein